jgi:hypothetical protein
MLGAFGSRYSGPKPTTNKPENQHGNTKSPALMEGRGGKVAKLRDSELRCWRTYALVQAGNVRPDTLPARDGVEAGDTSLAPPSPRRGFFVIRSAPG